MILLLIACAGSPPLPEPRPEAPMSGVELAVGDDLTVTLASAWMDPDGSGRGEGAKAVVAGPPPLVVTGDRSSWRLKDGVVVFEGNVVAVRGDVTLRCATLEVIYDGDRVREARASGGVRVTRGTREARGDRAVLHAAEGRVELEGSPTVTEGPNRMTGDRIALFLDDERLECDRCRLEVSGQAVTPR